MALEEFGLPKRMDAWEAVHPPKDRAGLGPRVYVADMAIFVEASTAWFIMATSVTPDDASGALG